MVYPGPAHDTGARLWVRCDHRSVPCPWPESEVPNYSCGRVDEVRLKDSSALSAAISEDSVTITFDPNKLPAGSVPSGLAYDLAFGEEKSEHVATLTDVWVQTLLHQGVRGVESMSIGPGGELGVWDRLGDAGMNLSIRDQAVGRIATALFGSGEYAFGGVMSKKTITAGD